MTHLAEITHIQQEIAKRLSSAVFEHLSSLRHKQLEVLLAWIENERNQLGNQPRPDRQALLNKYRNLVGTFDRQVDSVMQLPVTAYIHLAEQTAGTFDEWITARQQEARFYPGPKDNTTVRLLKSFKRIAGQKNRVQKIPLRRLILSHLLGPESWLKRWMDAERHWIGQAREQLIRHLGHWSTIENVADPGDAQDIKPSEVEGRLESLDELRGGWAQFLEELQARLEKELAKGDTLLEEGKRLVLQQIETAVSLTGTVERGAGRYRPGKVKRLQRGVEKKLQNHFEALDRELVVNRDETTVRIEVIGLFLTLQGLQEKVEEDIDSFFRHGLRKPVFDLNKRLKTIREEIDAGDHTLDNQSSIERLRELREGLDSFFELHVLEPLRKMELNFDLQTRLDGYGSDAQLLSNRMSKELTLSKGKEGTAEKYRLAWSSAAARYLKEYVAMQLKPDDLQILQFLQQIRKDCDAIQQVSMVNLQSAEDAVRSKEERVREALQVAVDGLGRSVAKVDELLVRIDEKYEFLRRRVLTIPNHALFYLWWLVHNNQLYRLGWKEHQYQLREAAFDWRTRFTARWARLQDRLFVWGRFLGMKAKGAWKAVKGYLGFVEKQQPDIRQRADIAEYLSETDRKIAGLPFIYRKLFDVNAPPDRRFYFTPGGSHGIFKQAYEGWYAGNKASFSIVGEKGSGKSTYLELAIDEMSIKEKIYRVDLSATIWKEPEMLSLFCSSLDLPQLDTREDLVGEIRKTERRKVVVVEGLQNLYVRNINGFDALESFLLLLSATRDKIFWVTSCSRYAWDYLSRVESLSEYFTFTVESDRLDATQIRNLVLERHRASGYELEFTPSEGIQESRAYKKVLDDWSGAQKHLSEDYFQQLAKIAEGNASIAMIFWLRSIRDFDEQRFYISPLEVTAVDSIEMLTPEILFSLAALVLHDTATGQEMALALNQSEHKCELLLNRLLSRGLLVRQDGDLYTLNHLVYRQVVRALKQRNIIH